MKKPACFGFYNTRESIVRNCSGCEDCGDCQLITAPAPHNTKPKKPGCFGEWAKLANKCNECFFAHGCYLMSNPVTVGWPEYRTPMEGEKMSRDEKSSYYDAGGIEVQDIIKAKLTPEQYEGFCLGNVMKYSLRRNWKGTPERDDEKAANYAKWLVEARVTK